MRISTDGSDRARASRGRRGSALAFSLVAVVTVSILAASFLQVSSAVTMRQARSVDNKQAFYLAEAGLIEAYTGVRIGKTGTVGTSLEPAKFGAGLFWVETQDLGDGLIELKSTGMQGGGKVELSLVVERGAQSMAGLGVFSSEDLEIHEGSLIDGYDSREGVYQDQVEDGEEAATLRAASGGTQTTTQPAGGATGTSPGGKTGATGGGGLPTTTTSTFGGTSAGTTFDTSKLEIGMGNVGSNGNIVIHDSASSSTEIYGSVTPGPESQVTYVGSPLVTGVVEPAPESQALPPVAVPVVELAEGIQLAGGETRLLQSGELGFEYLTVTDGSDLVIQGPVRLVVGDLSLTGSSSIHFDTSNGPIEVFVTGQTLLAPGTSVVTTSTDPSRVTISVSGDAGAELSSTATFFGLVYAPESVVIVSSAFELFGALVAQRLELAAGVRMHFDLYLAELAADLARPANLSWRIVDFAPIAGAQPGGDPFVVLGVDPLVLPMPADAHEDVLLQLLYVDHSGTYQTYTGSENSFDWTTVSAVIGITRDTIPVQPGLTAPHNVAIR